MIASGLLAVLALGASLDAAEAPDDSAAAPPTGIETIIVQGDTLGLTVGENSSSVVVFTRRQLDLATELDIKELMARVPNVRVDPANGRITIRGMNDRGFSDFGGGNTSMLLDGVTYSFYGSNFTNLPLWDVSQVEVLRGPQIFEGLAVATGTIAVTTKRPTFTPDGAFQFDVTDEGRREVSAAYGNALVDDVLAFRVAMNAINDDGLIDNVTRSDSSWNDAERYLFRGRLLWRPAQWNDTEVRFDYQRAKDDLGAPTTRINHVLKSDGYNPFHRKTGIDTAVRVHQDFDVYNLEVEHPLGDSWRASYMASYQSGNVPRQVDDLDDTATPVGRVDANVNTKVYQGELRFRHDGPWTLIGSLYATEFNQDFQANVGFPFDIDGEGPIPPVNLVNQIGFIDHLEGYIAGAYASRTWFDRLTTDFGVRMLLHSQFDTQRPVTFFRSGSTGDPANDAAYDDLIRSFGDSTDRDFQSYTYSLPMASVTFAVTSELSAGVRYEQGYRIGYTDVNFARRTAAPYRPETSETIELFLRSQWFDGRATLNANLFETDYQDIQLRKCLSDVPGDCNVVNASSATTRGVELQLSSAPSHGVSAYLSVGSVDTQYKKVLAQIVESPTDRARNEITPWQVSVGIDYDRGQGLFAHIDTTHDAAGAVRLNSAYDVSAKTTNLVNARLGWRFPERRGMTWEVSTYVRNLFDEHYLEAVDPAQPDGFFQSAYVGDPRTIGLTLNVSL